MLKHKRSVAIAALILGGCSGATEGIGTTSTITATSATTTVTAPSTTASPASDLAETEMTPGEWTADEMNIARIEHTATRLLDGTVLVAGGESSFSVGEDVFSVSWAFAERFDPGTGSWISAGPMLETRVLHTATLLPDGRVLVVGGVDTGHPLASAELYDPESGTPVAWTATSNMSVARIGHTATLLPDRRVLIVGGSGGSEALASAEIYDPVSATWTATGDMVAPHTGHTATLLSNGMVLVAGKDLGTCARDFRGRRICQPSDPQPRSAELYDPGTGTWTTTGNMITPTIHHTATLLPDGNVLVTGGDIFNVDSSTTGDPLPSAELYDPESGTWEATSDMTVARDVHTATLLPDGTVLVVGGLSAGEELSLASAERYQPGSGSWFPASNMLVGRYFHTATLLLDGRVLVAGGLERDLAAEGGGNLQASAEVYDPNGA